MCESGIGSNFLHSERSYILTLITELETREVFNPYQTHPVHTPAKKRIHGVRNASIVCDYEIFEP